MGTIYYGGSATPIHIEDRALAHLKVEQPVIAVALKVAQNELLAAGHEDDAIVAGIRHGLAALRAVEVAEPWPEARWTRLKRFAAYLGMPRRSYR